jgi:hypothetical protein
LASSAERPLQGVAGEHEEPVHPFQLRCTP